MAWLHSTHSLIYAQVTTGEALHPLTVERLAPQLLGNEALAPVWKSTSASGAYATIQHERAVNF